MIDAGDVGAAFEMLEAVMARVPQKRRRRTKKQMAEIRDALFALVMANRPVTCRQAFYLAVSAGVIGKTESEYKKTVCRLLKEMRIKRRLPFDSIVDNTRWMRKPETFDSLEDALRITAEAYRRSAWTNQDVYVEVWTEKDALAGVLYEETSKWDVPLMVSKGFASVTFLHEAAGAIERQGKPTYIYYFGDRDPSGLAIDVNIESRLREFAPDEEIHFERVAVTEEQIESLDLPTRPTKKSDSRAKNFDGESVEVDAIPPAEIRRIARECIEQHIDRNLLERTTEVERQERETLAAVARTFSAKGGAS